MEGSLDCFFCLLNVATLNNSLFLLSIIKWLIKDWWQEGPGLEHKFLSPEEAHSYRVARLKMPGDSSQILAQVHSDESVTVQKHYDKVTTQYLCSAWWAEC